MAKIVTVVSRTEAAASIYLFTYSFILFIYLFNYLFYLLIYFQKAQFLFEDGFYLLYSL